MRAALIGRSCFETGGSCPLIDKEFAYYKQTYDGDLRKIGSVFADFYREWAWRRGKSSFPLSTLPRAMPATSSSSTRSPGYSRTLGQRRKGSYGSPELDAEIAALREISAHAVVTTNYDEVIEPLFTEYERVIGQKVLREPYLSIGEIFRLHGCS